MASLWEALRSYVADAAPGGLLNQEVPTVPTMLGGLLSNSQPMPTIGGLLSGIDNIKRVTANRLGDLINNPRDYLAMTAAQTPQTIAEQGAGMAPMGLGVLSPGMFIGKGAKTWDAVNMGKAQQMAEQGIDPRAIWKETGTWQGPDGAWRQEIPDNESFYRGSQAMGGGSRAGDLYLNPPLYDAYPSLANNTIHEHSGRVSSTNGRGQMTIAQGDAVSSTAHEMQHDIQEIEDWGRGGSVNQFVRQAQDASESISQHNKDLARLARQIDEAKAVFDTQRVQSLKARYENSLNAKLDLVPTAQIDPYSSYQRLLGEAEARTTQARINMDSAQRRSIFPADSYDVPLNQLIIRK